MLLGRELLMVIVVIRGLLALAAARAEAFTFLRILSLLQNQVHSFLQLGESVVTVLGLVGGGEYRCLRPILLFGVFLLDALLMVVPRKLVPLGRCSSQLTHFVLHCCHLLCLLGSLQQSTRPFHCQHPAHLQCPR